MPAGQCFEPEALFSVPYAARLGAVFPGRQSRSSDKVMNRLRVLPRGFCEVLQAYSWLPSEPDRAHGVVGRRPLEPSEVLLRHADRRVTEDPLDRVDVGPLLEEVPRD